MAFFLNLASFNNNEQLCFFMEVVFGVCVCVCVCVCVRACVCVCVFPISCFPFSVERIFWFIMIVLSDITVHRKEGRKCFI